MKGMVRSLALLAAFLCLSGALARPAQLIEGLVNIRFRADVRVFAVMAALNVADFDLDIAEFGPTSTRARIRNRLAGVDQDLRDRLHAFLAMRLPDSDDMARQATFISYALFLESPPKFSLAAPVESIPEEVRPLLGLESLVAELWQKGAMEELWDEVQPAYMLEVDAYRPLIREMVIDALRYMRTEARIALDRQVIFIPDLLNGCGVVNARNIGEDYIVVVGPSRERQRPMRAVRHEYLHFFVDPLIMKYTAYMPEAGPFLERVREQAGGSEAYGENFDLMLRESLIRVLEMDLDGDSGASRIAHLIGLYDHGLVLAPYFEEALHKFTGGTYSFHEMFPGVIEGITWAGEKERDRQVAELRKELAALRDQGSKAASTPSGMPPEMAELLGEANTLLQKREFSAAGKILKRALDLDEDNANALFGMAQVAAHDQELERALELYERAATNAGKDTWIAAWSYVHRGSLYEFLGESEKARAEWSKALKLEGNLRGADAAARSAMSK